MSFPHFPQFRKLTFEDRDEYLTYYKKVEPYSDFSFNNLLNWLDSSNDLSISKDKNNLILRFTNIFEAGETSYTLLGQRDCLETVTKVFELQVAEGESAHLVMVPACVIDDIRAQAYVPEKLIIKESREHCDYIFDVPSTIKMSGQGYANLRKAVARFKREHNAIMVKKLNLLDPDTAGLLQGSLAIWQQAPSFSQNDPAHTEIEALARYLKHAPWALAECLGLYIDSVFLGFSIYHFPPQSEWAIINHIKCSKHLKNSFDFLYYMTVVEISKNDVQHINGEQDLGIPGLRAHKLQLQPKGYLYRYDLYQTE